MLLCNLETYLDVWNELVQKAFLSLTTDPVNAPVRAIERSVSPAECRSQTRSLSEPSWCCCPGAASGFLMDVDGPYGDECTLQAGVRLLLQPVQVIGENPFMDQKCDSSFGGGLEVILAYVAWNHEEATTEPRCLAKKTRHKECEEAPWW